MDKYEKNLLSCLLSVSNKLQERNRDFLKISKNIYNNLSDDCYLNPQKEEILLDLTTQLLKTKDESIRLQNLKSFLETLL
jgi:hypothetical protein